LIHNFLPNNRKSKRNNPSKHVAFAATGLHSQASKQKDVPLEQVFTQPTYDPTWTDFAFAVTDPETGKALEYKELLQHKNDEFRNIGRFQLPMNSVVSLRASMAASNTPTPLTLFTSRETHLTKSHLRPRCVPCPTTKEGTNRTRITVGGNLIDYPGDVSTRTADLTTFKFI
jgi:hypothetical protein